MGTPSSARRWLIQAVFVSTRSPRSISVPMVTISALSMFFPFLMAVFYNPPYGGPREREHCHGARPGPGPLEALGEALRPPPEGGRYRRGTLPHPRPRRGPGAALRLDSRRGPRGRTGGVPEARGRVGPPRGRTGEAEPEALARAGRGGAGEARARGRGRKGPGGGPGAHHGEAGDGTARARAVRGGQDRTCPRLPERGAPAPAGRGGPARGRRRVPATRHRLQRGAGQGRAPGEPRGPRVVGGRSHSAGRDRAAIARRA